MDLCTLCLLPAVAVYVANCNPISIRVLLFFIENRLLLNLMLVSFQAASERLSELTQFQSNPPPSTSLPSLSSAVESNAIKSGVIPNPHFNIFFYVFT